MDRIVRTRWISWGWVCSAFIFLGIPLAVAAPNYTLTDLGDLPGGANESHATGINDAGQVAGHSAAAANTHAFVWSSTTGLQDIGALVDSSRETFAHAISSTGKVVGEVEQLDTSTFQRAEAFSWSSQTGVQRYPATGDTGTFASGVNRTGDLVGYSQSRTEGGARFTKPLKWTSPTMAEDLGFLDEEGMTGLADAINDAGAVVGESGDTSESGIGQWWHAFFWTEGGGMEDLGTYPPDGPAQDKSEAFAIDAAGDAVGYALNTIEHAVWWPWKIHSRIVDLGGIAPGDDSIARGINDALTIVGTNFDSISPFQARAFLWEAGRMQDLNSFIAASDPLQPYVKLVNGEAINELGQIAANGVDQRTGATHAYLLTPTPSESASVAACARSNKVHVDGDTRDWAGIPKHIIRHTHVTAGAVSDSHDLFATYSTQWDSVNLYVLFEVRDDTVAGVSSSAYLNDSVEVYIDAGHERGTAYDSNDYQLTVDLLGHHGGIRGDRIGYTSVAKQVPGGYVVEYAIPWSALGQAAQPNLTIGFDVAVNDNDTNTNVRAGQITWHGSGDVWMNPSSFGTLTLSSATCGHIQAMACKASSPRTIDGDPSDWGSEPSYPINAPQDPVVGNPVASVVDGQFRFQWDDTYLYALVQVSDPVVTGHDTHAYVNDGAELYIHGGNTPPSTTYGSTDFQLVVDWGGRVAGTRSNQISFRKATHEAANGHSYVVEYAVPWSGLGGRPADGHLPADIAINDNDDNHVRASQIGWAGDGTGYFNPSTFGDVFLSTGGCRN